MDQHHGSGSLASEIPADCRSLPVHLQIACILGVQHALAPLQKLAEILRRLVDENVPVRNMRAILEAVVE